MENNSIKTRNEVAVEDQWDLSSLFPSAQEWENGFLKMQELVKKASDFKGKLSESAIMLKSCLDYWMEVEELDERLGYYAHLRHTEDAGDSSRQSMFGRYMSLATSVKAASSYLVPEIQAIEETKLASFLDDKALHDYRIYIQRLLRYKAHILTEAEETIMAMQSESASTASKAFGALSDVDLEFGTVKTQTGEKPVSQSTFQEFLQNPDRNIRKEAYFKFYNGFEKHKNTIAALYTGSINQDIFTSRTRKFSSSRAASLFFDNIPEEVYDSLVAAVRKTLPSLHKYYAIRQRALGLPELRHYDSYVSLVPDVKTSYPFDKAVDTVCEAMSVLGSEYVDVLRKGLTEKRWVDKYENKGKRSGAFSAGSYSGEPYILMNYKENVLRDLFTLAHEAGHSMHSYFCAKNNPIQHYNYTIFEAETASTFNEQLLFDYLEKQAADPKMKSYLLAKRIDDILATLFRQTMFAEFEMITHQLAESGNALTVDLLRQEYRKLLQAYFGPSMVFEDVSDMEGLRIPHFYRAFYVYKYATGICASMTLSSRVLSGGSRERDDYLGFLKTGGSLYPIESLKRAGADLGQSSVVENGLKTFSSLVDKLEISLFGA